MDDRIQANFLKAKQQLVAEVIRLAQDLPEDAVRKPDMPIRTFLEEGLTMVATARNSEADLSRVGTPPDLADHLEALLAALSFAQAQWIAERRGGRGEETAGIIDEARTLADDLMAAGGLALRDDQQGLEQLAEIRKQNDIPDLISDLTDLATLLTDKKSLFEALRMDVEAESKRVQAMRKTLQRAHSEKSVAKPMAMDREIRDRIFTLAVNTAEELRAFGTFAFKKDKTDKRRTLFTSDYSREKMRRHRAKQAGSGLGKKNKSYFTM